MLYAKRRRDHAPLATLAAVAIVASLLAFHWFAPFSSKSPLDCGSDCSSRPALAGGSDGESGTAADRNDGNATPAITARSAVVVDGPCGEIIFAKEPHLRLPPASLTKIMTAVVALETADADDIVDVNIDGFYFGDSTVMGLESGMRLSLRDLLYGLLLPSGNDAAVAIARYVAGDVPSFVARMNAKVRALGLQDTHFTNPHGLDAPGHYSSAYDMAMLARYAMTDPDLAEIVKTKVWQPAWDGPQLWNGNLLLWTYPDSDGVKIGWTENARQTIVASAQRDGRRLFVALLGSEDRFGDATALLDWAFENSEAGNSGEECNQGGS
jgi:D-alanyl-D-alanine carboxypeptidase (penicillin-binding protein 5/6)